MTPILPGILSHRNAGGSLPSGRYEGIVLETGGTKVHGRQNYQPVALTCLQELLLFNLCGNSRPWSELRAWDASAYRGASENAGIASSRTASCRGHTSHAPCTNSSDSTISRRIREEGLAIQGSHNLLKAWWCRDNIKVQRMMRCNM